MNKQTLEDLISKGFSTYRIAKELNCSQTNVRHWLKKYNLKTCLTNTIENGKICPYCKTFKLPEEYYKRRQDGNLSSYCKNCSNEQTIVRQRALKDEAVRYLGGKCISCGYDNCNGALQFHHKNPEEKEFTIAHCKLYSFEKIVEELNKCVLLCANCHLSFHSGCLKLKL